MECSTTTLLPGTSRISRRFALIVNASSPSISYTECGYLQSSARSSQLGIKTQWRSPSGTPRQLEAPHSPSEVCLVVFQCQGCKNSSAFHEYRYEMPEGFEPPIGTGSCSAIQSGLRDD